MKLAYFTQPVHPLDRDYRAVLRENIDAIALADRLGYEEALVGEHFTDLAEPITSALMFLARLVPETKRIRLGSAVCILPMYSPARLLSEIGFADTLSNGRLELGIGSGYQNFEFERFGV